MRNAYIFHRLRKYRRKQFHRSDPLGLKKYRYWLKMYGGHKCLWNVERN